MDADNVIRLDEYRKRRETRLLGSGTPGLLFKSLISADVAAAGLPLTETVVRKTWDRLTAGQRPHFGPNGTH